MGTVNTIRLLPACPRPEGQRRGGVIVHRTNGVPVRSEQPPEDFLEEVAPGVLDWGVKDILGTGASAVGGSELTCLPGLGSCVGEQGEALNAKCRNSYLKVIGNQRQARLPHAERLLCALAVHPL